MKDQSTYYYNGEQYGKGQLVLACLKQFISERRNIKLDNLQRIFPKYINKYYDVIADVKSAKRASTSRARYFFDSPITLRDGTKVVICNQWAINNVGLIITLLRTDYGFDIRKKSR